MTTRDDAATSDPIAELAVAAIASALLGRPVPAREGDDSTLNRLGASFVTVDRAGRLRGCIGSLYAARPLRDDITRNAIRALRDPRLPAVTADEWPQLTVSVSVLSKPEPLPVGTIDDIHDLIRPGVDGLTLATKHSRATFLPSVWRSLPEPRSFLAALIAKGGWTVDDWPTDLRVERYTTTSHISPAPRPPLETL
ncbi:AmmeMemoRadiSam system protein A [Stackebrandtia soli]|uniref:AmmeMemoRadiSam system protein A n=1 Tax=Stackebrandtia soli TaxID=1892856 RepID=UPI0039EA20E2